MFWIPAALISTAIHGGVAIVDSHLVTRRMPSLPAYFLPMGLIHLVIGSIVYILNPFPADMPLSALLVAVLAGMLRAVGVYLMLSAMQKSEVSRVVPVVNTYPIFVALMAVPLLGEAIGYREWLGILITVTGAMFISIHRRGDGAAREYRFDVSLVMLLASSLLFAGAFTAGKYALEGMSYWNLYTVNAACFGTVLPLYALFSKGWQGLKTMPRRNQALVVLTVSESVSAFAIVLSNAAIAAGPVSLVTTVLSTRPAFVFAMTLVLSRFFPAVLEEKLSRGIVLAKVAAILMIIGGVILLTF
ncbi:MAG: EamA family transporter [Dehalococcoidia bacterium]|nr:EamA family transporter [Dehalococcoidia bacterium]